LLSPTGFFSHNSLIFLTSIELCSLIVSFRLRMEVESGREGRVMSKGGLRKDLRETVIERSAPGANLIFFSRWWEALGRMY
jgi:hypothetical protein